MKLTVDIPDDEYERLKVAAAAISDQFRHVVIGVGDVLRRLEDYQLTSLPDDTFGK